MKTYVWKRKLSLFYRRKKYETSSSGDEENTVTEGNVKENVPAQRSEHKCKCKCKNKKARNQEIENEKLKKVVSEHKNSLEEYYLPKHDDEQKMANRRNGMSEKTERDRKDFQVNLRDQLVTENLKIHGFIT